MGKNLSDKQLAVLKDIFGSALPEKKVLSKHGIRVTTYNRWLSQPYFAEEFEKRTNALNRRLLLYIAKNSFKAAEKLVELVESEKSETARKACLDIIGMLSNNKKKIAITRPSETDNQAGEFRILPELASKLLKILAEEKVTKR